MKSKTINIKHPGLLHSHLGIAPDKKIPMERLKEAKHSKNPAIRKEANFAINFHGKKKKS